MDALELNNFVADSQDYLDYSKMFINRLDYLDNSNIDDHSFRLEYKWSYDKFMNDLDLLHNKEIKLMF